MKCAFAIPGDLATPTGGYAYDRRVMALLPEFGVTPEHVALPGGFPDPSKDELVMTRDRLAALPHNIVLLADGLAYGALPESVLRAIPSPIVALVHHPLAFETGTPPARAAALEALERAALAHARRVIATSPATARLLVERYDVPEHHLTVAVPGVDPAPRAIGSGSECPALLAVGAVSRRKGYAILVRALARLPDLPWRLTIVGALDRSPDAVAELRATIAQVHLGDRIRLAGALSEAELSAAYASADVFVMPSLFEGYGMVVTEAIARGLPIVATTGGALADIVPAEAALRVPPADEAALAAALRRMLAEPALRAAKSASAWALAGDLPRWRGTAAIIARVIKEVGA